MTGRGQGHSSAQPFPRPEILGGREGRARGGGRRRSGGGIPIQNIFRPTGHLPGFHQHQPPLRWAAVPPLSTRALSRRRRGDGRCIKRLDPTFRAPPRPLAPPRVRIMFSLFARPARAPPPCRSEWDAAAGVANNITQHSKQDDESERKRFQTESMLTSMYTFRLHIS